MAKKAGITPERKPELAARNIRYLLAHFNNTNFTQNKLSVELDMTTSMLSNYLSGKKSTMWDLFYPEVSLAMAEMICTDAERTNELINIAKLEDFHFEALKSDTALQERIKSQFTSTLKGIELDPEERKRLKEEAQKRQEEEERKPREEEDQKPQECDERKSLEDGEHKPQEDEVHKQREEAERKQRDEEERNQREEDEKERKRLEKLRIKKRKYVIVGCVVVVLCIGFIGVIIWNLLPPKVYLEITNKSALNETNGFVAGTIRVSRGNPEDYRVTMAVLSPNSNHIYAPKPSRETPTAIITKADKANEGYFNCVFAAGNSPDNASKMLYVYVVPADFIPNEDIDRTIAAKVASEEIPRD